jgi:hypothetical protein
MDLGYSFGAGRFRRPRFLGWVPSRKVRSRWCSERRLRLNCGFVLRQLATSKEQVKIESTSNLEL